MASSGELIAYGMPDLYYNAALYNTVKLPASWHRLLTKNHSIGQSFWFDGDSENPDHARLLDSVQVIMQRNGEDDIGDAAVRVKIYQTRWISYDIITQRITINPDTQEKTIVSIKTETRHYYLPIDKHDDPNQEASEALNPPYPGPWDGSPKPYPAAYTSEAQQKLKLWKFLREQKVNLEPMAISEPVFLGDICHFPDQKHTTFYFLGTNAIYLNASTVYIMTIESEGKGYGDKCYNHCKQDPYYQCHTHHHSYTSVKYCTSKSGAEGNLYFKDPIKHIWKVSGYYTNYTTHTDVILNDSGVLVDTTGVYMSDSAQTAGEVGEWIGDVDLIFWIWRSDPLERAISIVVDCVSERSFMFERWEHLEDDPDKSDVITDMSGSKFKLDRWMYIEGEE